MKQNTNIVVVVNRSVDAQYVLEKAAAISQSSERGASVYVVRVMYEEYVEHTHLDKEQTQALKLYLMQAEEEFLVDLVESHRNKFADIETATLWNKRVSDAIKDLAKSYSADLIIKSADPDSAHFPRHPDDWNLLRDASCPVFLVQPKAWPTTPVVLAGVNISDIEHRQMNTQIITNGAKLARSLNAQLHIVNAIPNVQPMLANTEIGIDFERLEQDVVQETRRQLDELITTLELCAVQIHVESGQPAKVVAEVAEKVNADAVIVGTAGRHGVSGFIIGNTSERLLHLLHQDLLVLPV